jgi:hypothetical protein
MKKNERSALLRLIGGVGLIILLGGIFTDLYPFTYGLFAALAIWILSGVVSAYYGDEKGKSRRRR